MALIVSILGMLTTLVCAVLLLRQYLLVHQKLLLWSGLCFTGLTISNALLCLDQVASDPVLYLPRLAIAATSMLVLVFGLVFEGGRA